MRPLRGRMLSLSSRPTTISLLRRRGEGIIRRGIRSSSTAGTSLTRMHLSGPALSTRASAGATKTVIQSGDHCEDRIDRRRAATVHQVCPGLKIRKGARERSLFIPGTLRPRCVGSLLEELAIPEPDYNLGIGSRDTRPADRAMLGDRGCPWGGEPDLFSSTAIRTRPRRRARGGETPRAGGARRGGSPEL